MAIIITSGVAGSIKINNTSASPQSYYLCNLKTVTVQSNVGNKTIDVLNYTGQPLLQAPLALLASIGVSASPFSYQSATDALATLIISV